MYLTAAPGGTVRSLGHDIVLEQRCWECAAAALSGGAMVHELARDEHEPFVRWASDHRLAGLLWHVAESSVHSGAVPDGLFHAACRQVAYSVYQEQELRRVP